MCMTSIKLGISVCQTLQGLMMLPTSALVDESTAVPLVLRAWCHEAVRTFADRIADVDARAAIVQEVRYS